MMFVLVYLACRHQNLSALYAITLLNEPCVFVCFCNYITKSLLLLTPHSNNAFIHTLQQGVKKGDYIGKKIKYQLNKTRDDYQVQGLLCVMVSWLLCDFVTS